MICLIGLLCLTIVTGGRFAGLLTAYLYFIGDFALPRNCRSFCFNSLFFFLGVYGPFECHHSVLCDDFNVVCVSGKRFVFHNCASNLPGKFPIRSIVLLLIRSRFGLAPIALVDFGVVGGLLALLGVGVLRPDQSQSAKKNYQETQ